MIYNYDPIIFFKFSCDTETYFLNQGVFEVVKTNFRKNQNF